MNLQTSLISLVFLLGLYIEKNNGEFSCFRKFRKKNQNCGGLLRTRRIDTAEKCCTAVGQGFTVQKLDKLGKNKYSCLSCKDWYKQKNEPKPLITTQSTVTQFVCFRKYREKSKQCGGPFKKFGMTSPETCCNTDGNGFSTVGRNKLAKNRYTCTSCQEWYRQNGRRTSPKPALTTTTALPAEWSQWSDCSASCGSGWQTRHRQCSNCDRAHYTNIQQKPCIDDHYCPTDGNWGSWLPWNQCSDSCAGGIRRRERICDDPPPVHGGQDCDGEDEEEESCNEQPCPISVDGNWGKWSRFGHCSKTCGMGTMVRTRSCDNPPPSNGGADCKGHRTHSRRCERRKCAIHGGWSAWGEWSECPVKCGTGTWSRSRECNRPRPLFGGRSCRGPEKETGVCDSGAPCPIHGGWSAWSSYGRCRAKPCQNGHRLRSRACNDPRPEHRGLMCRGKTLERTSCFNSDGCPVNGGWCEFSDWSICSATCSSFSSIQSRHRECHCPPPQNGGDPCPDGDRVQVKECRGNNPCDEPMVNTDG